MATPKIIKKKGDATQGVVVQNIVIRPVVRSSQDIEKWRNALQSAEAITPIRVPLYDLYEDLRMDAVLSNLMEKRVLGVTKNKLSFVDENGKENEDIALLISNSQFRELRKELVRQKFWGITVAELMVVDGKFKCYSIPRKHIKPDIGKITYEQYGSDGIDYREQPYNKYIVEVGKCDDLGLFLKAAPYVIYKRGCFGDWAHYAEIFGMPFREARYDGYNQQVRAQLEQALEQAGSASYAILPKEAEITFHEAANTQGSAQLYDMLRKACNEELSILVLGQSGTTIATPGKLGNDDTNANTEDDINADDRADELSILNEQVIPILANLGYPVSNGKFVHVPDKEQLNLKDKASVLVQLKTQGGLPIDDDYLYEEFGIPKPTNYADLKAKQEAEKQAPPGDPGKPPAKKKQKVTDKKLSAKQMDEYLQKMEDFFGEAPAS